MIASGGAAVIQRKGGGGTKQPNKGGSGGGKKSGVKPAAPSPAELARQADTAAQAKLEELLTHTTPAEGAASYADSLEHLVAARPLNDEIKATGTTLKQVLTRAGARVAAAEKAVANKKAAKDAADLFDQTVALIMKKQAALAAGTERAAKWISNGSAAEKAVISAPDLASAEKAEQTAATVLKNATNGQQITTRAIAEIEGWLAEAAKHQMASRAAAQCPDNDHLAKGVKDAEQALANSKKVQEVIDDAVKLAQDFAEGASAALARRRADWAKVDSAQKRKEASAGQAATDSAAAKGAATRLAELEKAHGEAESSTAVLLAELKRIEAEHDRAVAAAKDAEAFRAQVAAGASGEIGLASDAANDWLEGATEAADQASGQAETAAAELAEASAQHREADQKLAESAVGLQDAKNRAATTKAAAKASKSADTAAGRELKKAEKSIEAGQKQLSALRARREAARNGTPTPAPAPDTDVGSFFTETNISRLAPNHAEALIAWARPKLLDVLERLLEAKTPIPPDKQQYILPLLEICGKTAEGIDAASELIQINNGDPEYLDKIVKHGGYSERATLGSILKLADVTAKQLAFLVDPNKGGHKAKTVHDDLSQNFRMWEGAQQAWPALAPHGTKLADIEAHSAPCTGNPPSTGGATYAGNRHYNNLGGVFENGMRLPTNVTWTEYDCKPFQPGVNRGSRRLVVGSNGWVFYTPDHYVTMFRVEPTPAIAP